MKKLLIILIAVSFILTSVMCNKKEDSKTELTIKNNSSYNLDLISWNGTYFGEDQVYDYVLQEYATGILAGNSSTKEVSAGAAQINFFFASGGGKYVTQTYVTVDDGDSETFTFTDSTLVDQAGSSKSPGTIEIIEADVEINDEFFEERIENIK